MKAILKKDFYENFKSIFVNIIFLILFIFILNRINIADDLRKTLLLVLAASSVIILVNFSTRDINNSSFKDLLRYPIERKEILKVKYFEYISLSIFYIVLGFFCYYLAGENSENFLLLFFTFDLLSSLISFTIPICLYFSGKNKSFEIIYIVLVSALFKVIIDLFIKIGSNLNISVYAYVVIMIILTIIIYLLSFFTGSKIIRKKEF